MEAKDAYQVAHQLALNEDVENAAGQWERVASLATKMLGAAYEISSSEGPAAIEFAEKAKAEAECEVKEAVLADAARAHVDAARRAQTADDWRSVVAFAARRLRASMYLPLSVENRAGKIQDAKEAKAEAERKAKEEKDEAKAEAERKEKEVAARVPNLAEISTKNLLSVDQSKSRSAHIPQNHKAAVLKVIEDISVIKTISMDGLKWGPRFNADLEDANIRVGYTTEAGIVTFVMSLLHDTKFALVSWNEFFKTRDPRFVQEAGAFAFRSDVLVIVGPDGTPVGVIVIKKPTGDPLKDSKVCGQLYDYMRMLRLYKNLDKVFGIATTLVDWLFAWLDDASFQALCKGLHSEHFTSPSPTSSPAAAGAAPSTPQRPVSQTSESSPPRTPARGGSSMLNLSALDESSTGEDHSGDVDDSNDSTYYDGGETIDESRKFFGYYLSARKEAEAELIPNHLVTFLGHMATSEPRLRLDPLEDFPVRYFVHISNKDHTVDFDCAHFKSSDFEIGPAGEFANNVQEMRKNYCAEGLDGFGNEVLAEVRKRVFVCPPLHKVTDLLLVEDLGYGGSARAFLACTKNASAFCVAKCARSESKDWTFENAQKSLTAEAELWREIYGIDETDSVLVSGVHVEAGIWGGRPVLLMPYCQPIPEDEREKRLGLVQNTLVEHFYERGYVHHDVHWRNIGLIQANGEVKAVVYDLAPHGNPTNGVCKAPSDDLTDSLAQMSMSSVVSERNADELPEWIAEAMKNLRSTM